MFPFLLCFTRYLLHALSEFERWLAAFPGTPLMGKEDSHSRSLKS
jgi:hypothetical protein